MLDPSFFGALAFLEMLASRGGAPQPYPQPSPAPQPMPVPVLPVQPAPTPPYVPPPPVAPAVTPPAQPAVFVMPPPGVIDVPPAPEPPPLPVVPVPVVPPVEPGVLPPMPPWNQGVQTPCPADSPPFPGSGWTPDTPVSTAVAARALYWNAILWDFASKTIAHPSVCEQFGGRWLTFAAAWHPGENGPQTYMATEAWRMADAPSPPPAPVPVIPPAPAPVPVVVNTPLQAAAVTMANALNAHGYRQADQPLYRAFQTAAKTSADGFPGTGTMTLLRSVLASMAPPVPFPAVMVFPWKATTPGGATGQAAYDGVNAPTWQQWTGQAPAPSVIVTPGQPVIDPSAPPAYGPPPLVGPYPGTGAWQTNGPYIARYQNALIFLGYNVGPTGADGKYGPNTAAAVKLFQQHAGLSPVDGEAGAATAAALDAALSHGA